MTNRLKMTDIQAILQLHSVGLSQREIARRLSVDRGSVAKAIQSLQVASKPANAPTGSGGSKPATLEGVQPVIRACILELLVRKNGPRAMLWVSKVHGKHWQGGRYEHRREEGV